jgi:hypothetical protein
VQLFEDFYHWNMQFSEDQSVKGDFDVVVSGTTAIMAREIQSQKLLSFIDLIIKYPPFAERLKSHETIMEMGKLLEVDTERLLMDDAEFNAVQQQRLQLLQLQNALQGGAGLRQMGGPTEAYGQPGMAGTGAPLG